MKLICLVALILMTGISLADGLSGKYEFQPPDGMDGDTAIVQLNEDDEGNHSAQVTVAEETIKGTNVVVGENEFSFEIEVEMQDEVMSQTYKVQLDDGEVTLSVMSELGGRSESMKFKGKLVITLDGTYEFWPPEGVQGPSVSLHLTKDDDDNFSVTVTVGDDTIETKNLAVSQSQFSFDSEIDGSTEGESQSWKIQVTDSEAKLLIYGEVDGEFQSMTLKGTRVEEDTESEN